jgi:hypothetical protein
MRRPAAQVTSGATAADAQRPTLRAAAGTRIVLRQGQGAVAPSGALAAAAAGASGAPCAAAPLAVVMSGSGSAPSEPAARATAAPAEGLAGSASGPVAARARGGGGQGGRGRKRRAAPPAADPGVLSRARVCELLGGRLPCGPTVTSSAAPDAAASLAPGFMRKHTAVVGSLPPAPASAGPGAGAGPGDKRAAQQARWQALSSLAAASAATQAVGAGLTSTRRALKDPEHDLMDPKHNLDVRGAGARSASHPHPVRLQLHAPSMAVLRASSAPSISGRGSELPSPAAASPASAAAPALGAAATVVPRVTVAHAVGARPNMLPAAPVGKRAVGTHGARALALSPFASLPPAAATGTGKAAAGGGPAALQRADGSGSSSDSDTSGSDTEKRFAAEVRPMLPCVPILPYPILWRM